MNPSAEKTKTKKPNKDLSLSLSFVENDPHPKEENGKMISRKRNNSKLPRGGKRSSPPSSPSSTAGSGKWLWLWLWLWCSDGCCY